MDKRHPDWEVMYGNECLIAMAVREVKEATESLDTEWEDYFNVALLPMLKAYFSSKFFFDEDAECKEYQRALIEELQIALGDLQVPPPPTHTHTQLASLYLVASLLITSPHCSVLSPARLSPSVQHFHTGSHTDIPDDLASWSPHCSTSK